MSKRDFACNLDEMRPLFTLVSNELWKDNSQLYSLLRKADFQIGELAVAIANSDSALPLDRLIEQHKGELIGAGLLANASLKFRIPESDSQRFDEVQIKAQKALLEVQEALEAHGVDVAQPSTSAMAILAGKINSYFTQDNFSRDRGRK